MAEVYQVQQKNSDNLGTAMQLFNTIRSFKGGGAKPETEPEQDPANGVTPQTGTPPPPQGNSGAMGDYPSATPNVFQRKLARSY